MSKNIIFRFGDYGVDVKVNSRTTPGVIWSDPNSASYVLVADKCGAYQTQDDQRVQVVSVNGIGEVRWVTYPHDQESPRLCELFNITPHKGDK